jgi:flagella basal body P-ring formation protein FlgA
LIGRRAKTTIKALTPVFSRQLETNFMIEENMQVTIIHHGKHISVQMEGVALENGQYGDWINVKNRKSGRIILAKVIAEKKVKI